VEIAVLRVFEILTWIGAVTAALLLIVAMGAPYAPAQSALIALAIALVTIPYCLAGVLFRRRLLDRMPPASTPTRSARQSKRPKDATFEPLDF
jgi:hypothetical protein